VILRALNFPVCTGERRDMEDKITKEVMEQYEAIRRSGVTNMFDYFTVIEIALKARLSQLGHLSRDEYIYILQNFGRLMKKYDIKQNKKEE
jgi:hypothetical protein